MVGKVSRGGGRAADFFRARVLISRGAVATFRGMTTARKSRSAAAASAAALLACALLAAAGCGGRPDEAREARHPLLRKAAAAREAEDADRAIALCERLLRRHPDNSAAHRELALLLDHYRDDAPGAIVHYRRYLELRPDSAQREAVEEMLHHCEVAYGAHLVQAPDSLKRELAARQLVARAAAIAATNGWNVGRLLVAGDFNTAAEDPRFAGEKTMRIVRDAGFRDAFEGIPEADRPTLPANDFYPPATFDHLLVRGLPPPLARSVGADIRTSDHRPVRASFPLSP